MRLPPPLANGVIALQIVWLIAESRRLRAPFAGAALALRLDKPRYDATRAMR
jgi:hypothetical protein